MSERVRHRVDSADWSAVPHPHVIELVRQGCAEDPERPAIILEDGLIVTRRELLDRSQRFAGYLRSRLKLGDRVVSLHLKDMAPGADKKFAEVGTGILDFKSIIAAGQKAGVRYGAVEQDNCYGQSTLGAIKTSFENLKRLNT